MRPQLLPFASILLIQVTAQPTAKVGSTFVVGTQLPGSIVDFFGGIPYAKPPLGPLRLNLPVLTPTLDAEIFNATNFGPACIQIPSPPSGISEDCLSLSIFRPSYVPSSRKIPVIAWLYGGSFVVGDSALYDATKLVTRSMERDTPVIFVSINYRIGPLGFPMGREAELQNVLNLGMHDQLAALQWIQANIVEFGGDPSKVTLMGQGAGAVSILAHTQGTGIARLARAAILESGALIPLFDPKVKQGDWESYVSAISGCFSSIAENRTIDCIRNSNTSSLLQAANNITSGGIVISPVIDGPQGLIPGRWSQNPPQARLPLLIGSNLDEGTTFTVQATNSSAQIRDAVLRFISPTLLGPDEVNNGLDTLLELYPDDPSLGSPFGTGNDTFGLNSQYKRLSAILGDMFFTSGRRTVAQAGSRAGQKIFAYLFNDHEAKALPAFTPPRYAPGSLGVPHTSEIPFVLGTLDNVSSNAMTLSTMIQDYWLSFVHYLDPNDNHGDKRPAWQEYSPDTELVALLGDEAVGMSMTPDNFREDQLAFFSNNSDLFHT